MCQSHSLVAGRQDKTMLLRQVLREEVYLMLHITHIFLLDKERLNHLQPTGVGFGGKHRTEVKKLVLYEVERLIMEYLVKVQYARQAGTLLNLLFFLFLYHILSVYAILMQK
jgi:hypothetical protein